MDFSRMKRDILKDTYELLDDLKSGRPLDIDKCFDKFFNRNNDNFFSSDFDIGSRRRSRDRTRDNFTDRYTSFPNFSTTNRTTTESDHEPTATGDKYTKTRVRRSESTYSTSSYDTTDSTDTLSELSDSSFSPNYKTTQPYNRNRSYSSGNPRLGDLNKKLEDEFLNDERHSMPHEVFSKCKKYLNDLDLDRPRSVPPEATYAKLSPYLKDSSVNSDASFPRYDTNSHRYAGSKSASLLGSHGYGRQSPPPSAEADAKSDSKSTLTGSESRLNSLDNFDFPSLSDVRSEAESLQLIPPPPYSPPVSTSSCPPVFPESKTTSSPTSSSSSSHLDTVALTQKLKDENKVWEERHGRIEDALKWLTTELGGLRQQDKKLFEDLNRCQDTIETIKKQRAQADEDIGEEDEDHWEDWEIAEFDRKCKEEKEKEEQKDEASQASSASGTEPTAKSNTQFGSFQDIQEVL